MKTELEPLDYPPLTEDLEEAKNHLNDFGVCIIKNAFSAEEVEIMDKRLKNNLLVKKSMGLALRLGEMKVMGLKVQMKRRSVGWYGI